MDTKKGILFEADFQQALKDRFYYADYDPAGAERLFFDNSGGSLRLKAALEAKATIEQLPTLTVSFPLPQRSPNPEKYDIEKQGNRSFHAIALFG